MYELDAALMREITDLRVAGGDALLEHARSRARREEITEDGRLVILAADHPARMVTGVGDDPVRMGDRGEYLGRIVRVMRSGFVDGLMTTPDLMEEVLAIDLNGCGSGGESFLDRKVLIGCMNRGGLAGTTFEMDDHFTAFTAQQMAAMNLDGAKLMFRLEPLEFGSGRTIEACSRAINECVDRELTAFLEALMVSFQDGKYVVDKSVEALVRICGVASALGRTSWKTWLKLPHTVDYSLVARATTCPILMLGGPATGDPGGLFADFVDGMSAGDNVRGALVGRNVLFPGDEDPAAVAAGVWAVVHSGPDLAGAQQAMAEARADS